MKYIVSLITGLIFGVGLGFSGMLSPEKVRGFLDITGRWDPSLALVMGGALAVTVVTFPLILKKGHPMLDSKFFLPTSKEIDRHILIGPVLFGVGWGLVGICPGPGIANLAVATVPIVAFTGTLMFFLVLTDVLMEKISFLK
jgi:uncharacterized membrane protein YedE/YeeE